MSTRLAPHTSETAFIALGSNIGDKAANLRAAMGRLAALPGTRLLDASAIYRTPPWGNEAQDWFANAVIRIETTLQPEALLEAALGIERAMGRLRAERWGPRVIDIDLLLHGHARRESESLTLPHPAMHLRAFVLVPLREIAPELKLAGENLGVYESLGAHLARLDVAGIEVMGQLQLDAQPA